MRNQSRAPAGQVFALAVPRQLGTVRVLQLVPGPATRSYVRTDLEGRLAAFPGSEVVLVADPPFVSLEDPS